MAATIHQLRPLQRSRSLRATLSVQNLVTAGGIRPEAVADAINRHLDVPIVTAAVVRRWAVSDYLPTAAVGLLAES